MRTKYRKDTKKCPRCGKVCLQSQKICDECGLVFARLDEATNEEARKQFFAKDKSIVMTSNLPKDVIKWKLLLFCGFLGLFGVHNLYVGRFYRGFYMLFFGLLSLVYVSINNPDEVVLNFMSSWPIVVCVAILSIFWISDFIQVVFNKFKVPVALVREK